MLCNSTSTLKLIEAWRGSGQEVYRLRGCKTPNRPADGPGNLDFKRLRMWIAWSIEFCFKIYHCICIFMSRKFRLPRRGFATLQNTLPRCWDCLHASLARRRCGFAALFSSAPRWKYSVESFRKLADIDCRQQQGHHRQAYRDDSLLCVPRVWFSWDPYVKLRDVLQKFALLNCFDIFSGRIYQIVKFPDWIYYWSIFVIFLSFDHCKQVTTGVVENVRLVEWSRYSGL